MSGMWKRSTVQLVRHRQTKEPGTDRLNLNHRATSRLYHPPTVEFSPRNGVSDKWKVPEPHNCVTFCRSSPLPTLPSPWCASIGENLSNALRGAGVFRQYAERFG